MGKSLFVSERVCELETALHQSKKYSSRSRAKDKVITIPVQGTHVNTKVIVNLLLKFEEKIEDAFPRIYHFDISPMVCYCLTMFYFCIYIRKKGKVKWNPIMDICFHMFVSVYI